MSAPEPTAETPVCASCGKEAKSACGACKTTRYCSPVCQNTDWPTHKKQCSGRQPSKKAKNQQGASLPQASPGTKNGPQGMSWFLNGATGHAPNMPFPEGVSPFGVMYDTKTGQMKPMSSATHFFKTDEAAYSRESPHLTYAELIEAYKFRRRSIALKQGKKEEEAIPQDLEDEMDNFRDYWIKVEASGMLPTWWDNKVHEPEVMKLVSEDESFKVTNPCNMDRGFRGISRVALETRLGMMAERAYGKFS